MWKLCWEEILQASEPHIISISKWGIDHNHKPWSPFTKHTHTQRPHTPNTQCTTHTQPHPLYHPHMLTKHPDNANRNNQSKEIYTTSYTNHPHPPTHQYKHIQDNKHTHAKIIGTKTTPQTQAYANTSSHTPKHKQHKHAPPTHKESTTTWPQVNTYL